MWPLRKPADPQPSPEVVNARAAREHIREATEAVRDVATQIQQTMADFEQRATYDKNGGRS